MTLFKSVIRTAHGQASISDSALNVEAAVEGLSSPTSMAFLDDNNIIVLEKGGSVRLISNGILQERPISNLWDRKNGPASYDEINLNS